MPDLAGILARLEADLGPRGGEPEPLDGGITNRNYRVRFGHADYVLRLPGKDTSLLGIDRSSERLAARQASALGIGPELVSADEESSVTRFVRCAQLDEAARRGAAAELGRALRAFHDSGLELPSRFWVPNLLTDYSRLVQARGGQVGQSYADAKRLADRIAGVLPLVEPVPGHNDLLPGNILRGLDDGRLLLVDWEYAGMGHRLFDLGNAAVNNDFDAADEDALLVAYFGEPATDARRAGLGLMRLMSDAREAAWGVVQGLISELDFDFEDYAATHFGRLERAASGEQMSEWLGEASAAGGVREQDRDG